MPRKKTKKTFFKIKEKLILVPPKKFVGRRFLGIICLICGSLVLAISLAYFYLIPNFFPAKTKIVEIREEKVAFVPKRLLFPYLGFDFPVENNVIETKFPLKNIEVEKGTEILVLSQNEYRGFQVTQVTMENSSSSSTLKFTDQGLNLVLQTKVKPPKTLIIEAE